MAQPHDRAGRRLTLRGRVQGVGLRPTAFRLAAELGLAGSVRNAARGVIVEIEGDSAAVARFPALLRERLPSVARLDVVHEEAIDPAGSTTFVIDRDAGAGPLLAEPPPDRSACVDCLAEVADPSDRRHRHPFASCLACGPRYSILASMPYERSATTMAFFDMCHTCAVEFADPPDRRFHAQTVACPQCGPRLWFRDSEGAKLGGDSAIAASVQELRDGRIVALRGVGGYQLLVDATNPTAVDRLRERKRRRAKPFAVLASSLPAAERLALPTDAERAALADSSNPIVLIRARGDSLLAPGVAPGLDRVGLLLPTTPLHAMLSSELDKPLLCTSGNREGDPIEWDVAGAERELAGIADAWLHHDRAIARPIDDSVVRIIADRPVTLRLARGLAPHPLPLPTAPATLATGAHMKAALAFSNGAQAALGPYLGDLDGARVRERFIAHRADCQRLYRFDPTTIVHDLHPDYFTTRWSAEQPVARLAIQHHHAHVVAGMLETGWLDRTVLGLAWDGTGYGPDGAIWGGEFLRATARAYERVACFRPFRLPGGESAIREPWRVALAVIADAVGPDAARRIPFMGVEESRRSQMLAIANRPRFSPKTTSVGRLFDAAAALALGRTTADYDGELAMLLEAVADPSAPGAYPIAVREGAPFELDWRPTFASLWADLSRGTPAPTVAMRFHRGLAAGAIEICRRWPTLPIVLGGGAFQNQKLTELLADGLASDGREIGLPGVLPPNDGGLAAGQLAAALAMQGHLSCV